MGFEDQHAVSKAVPEEAAPSSAQLRRLAHELAGDLARDHYIENISCLSCLLKLRIHIGLFHKAVLLQASSNELQGLRGDLLNL